ncbi:MAG: hypothetical protein IJS94_06955, partial [Clostridia bacterium]|nr:hypothetical protein [Clostridia bacterium]
TLPLIVEGEAFNDYRTDLNELLQQTVARMLAKKTTAAEISTKISIDLTDQMIPDEMTGELKAGNISKVKYKISAKMTVKDERGGRAGENKEYEMRWDQKTGCYALAEIHSQTSLFDYDKDDELVSDLKRIYE